jgi:hypothetical protein
MIESKNLNLVFIYQDYHTNRQSWGGQYFWW